MEFHIVSFVCTLPKSPQIPFTLLCLPSPLSFCVFYFLQPTPVILFEELFKSYWSHLAQMYGELEMPGSLCSPGADLSNDSMVHGMKAQIICLENGKL